MSKLSKLEKLQQETADEKIQLLTNEMPSSLKGLYYSSDDGIPPAIALNSSMRTETEKTCVLAEELGHYYTSTGNILDQTKVVNIKQEKRARNWGYEKLIPLQSFVEATREGVRNRYELAEFLGVTEDFLEAVINRYKEKYGLYVEWTSYVIYFEPLGVFKMYE